MSWRPLAPLEALQRRAAMLAAARAFFAQRNVLEVDTPILSVAAVSDPQLASLVTYIAGLPRAFFLQTSPEYPMKRLLAAGSGDIYQICKVFRDEELGRWHNPEFTMIEWYRIGFDDAALMDEVEALLRTLFGPQRRLPHAERLSYSAALQRYAGVDAHHSSDADLTAAAMRLGVVCETDLDRDAKLDLLMGLIVGPKLGHDRPCFICDYPASQAALARLKPGAPPVAARFELYSTALNWRTASMSWRTRRSSAAASNPTWSYARRAACPAARSMRICWPPCKAACPNVPGWRWALTASSPWRSAPRP